jgi:hypothetical protein
MPQGFPEIFVPEKTGIILESQKTDFTHKAPFMEADIDALDHRPDDKYGIQDKKRQ